MSPPTESAFDLSAFGGDWASQGPDPSEAPARQADALSSGTLDLGAFGMFGGEEPAAEPAPQPVSSTLDTGMLDLAAFGMDSGVAHAPAPAQESDRPSEAASSGMLDLAAFGMAEMSPAPQPAPAPAAASPRAEEPQLPRLRALGCAGRLPPAAGSQLDSQSVLESIEHLRTREGKLSADGSSGDSAADLLEACLVPPPLLVGVQQRVDAGGASYLRLLHGAVAQCLGAGHQAIGRAVLQGEREPFGLLPLLGPEACLWALCSGEGGGVRNTNGILLTS